jgi:hypothetical protein
LYAPTHAEPLYEVHLPFYTSDIQEKYWIALCFRGGQGFNPAGVTVSDPNALFINKPDVN